MESKSNSFDIQGLGSDARTPDSGIDMNKFNIVDYILDNSDWNQDQSVVMEATVRTTGNEEPTTKGTVFTPPSTTQAQMTSLKSSLPPLRTSSKQELQRRKALEESKREKEVKACAQPPPQSTPVDLPIILGSSPQVKVVPKELLTVETRLENPTRYHLQQCVRNNITRFALENNHKGGSVPPATFNLGGGMEHQQAVNQLRLAALHQQPGSAPPNIFAPDPHSPLPQVSALHSINSSVGTSITSGCSDMNDPLAALEVDSDLNMFSMAEINEIISQDEGDSVFSYSNHKSNFESSPQTPTSGIGGNGGQGSNTANGTPLQSPETPGGVDVKAAKDRQKKDNHNKIERRRRYLINDMITLQGQQLPKPSEPYYEKFGDVKQNKGAILQASVDYIQILKDENETFRQNEAKTSLKLQQYEQERKKLLLRIQELESVCRTNGIAIPEENLTWRPQQPDKISSLINEPILIKQEPRFCELMDEGAMVTGPGDPMLGSGEDYIPSDDIGMELS